VVDPGGYLVYFEKIDRHSKRVGCVGRRPKPARRHYYRRPSKVFFGSVLGRQYGFMSFPNDARPIASEGGIPIVVNGRLIGAIGASGGTGQQDSIAAMGRRQRRQIVSRGKDTKSSPDNFRPESPAAGKPGGYPKRNKNGGRRPRSLLSDVW